MSDCHEYFKEERSGTGAGAVLVLGMRAINSRGADRERQRGKLFRAQEEREGPQNWVLSTLCVLDPRSGRGPF